MNSRKNCVMNNLLNSLTDFSLTELRKCWDRFELEDYLNDYQEGLGPWGEGMHKGMNIYFDFPMKDPTKKIRKPDSKYAANKGGMMKKKSKMMAKGGMKKSKMMAKGGMKKSKMMARGGMKKSKMMARGGMKKTKGYARGGAARRR